MALNLLGIVQEHARRQGLPIPADVASNSDTYAQQCMGLLNKFNADLIVRKMWEVNVIETLFTSLATESQGSLDTLCPAGFQGIVLESVWDRTQMLNWFGGISSSEWQLRKASHLTGPITAFRLRNGKFLTNPPPAAGHTIAFEYFSSWFVRDIAAAPKRYWTANTDYSAVDEALPIAYLEWAWKAAKGFEYAEDFRQYETLIATALTRDDSPQVLSMSESYRTARPGILVPAGSWNVP